MAKGFNVYYRNSHLVRDVLGAVGMPDKVRLKIEQLKIRFTSQGTVRRDVGDHWPRRCLIGPHVSQVFQWAKETRQSMVLVFIDTLISKQQQRIRLEQGADLWPTW